MSHPKDTFLTNPSEIGKWVTEGLAKGAEEQQLANEVRMMQSEQQAVDYKGHDKLFDGWEGPFANKDLFPDVNDPNEMIKLELAAIERMKREGAVNVNE